MSKLPDSKPAGSGRKRKALTVGEKFEILKRYERNETTRDIVKATGIKESTLRTIRSNAEKIKQTCVSGTSSSIAVSIRTRPKILEEMEKLLSIWIETQTMKRIGTTFFTVRQKAVTIYEDLKKQSTNPTEIPPFTASSGWFCRFKNQYSFHNVRLCGEAGSADVDAVQTFPIEVQNLVKEKVTTEELEKLSVAGEAEGRKDDENQEVPPPSPRQMTTAELSDTLKTIEQRLQWLEDNDCNAERSGKTTRGIRACLEPYKQLLYERSTRAKQKKLEFYFTAMKKHCDNKEALPSTSNRTSVRP
ncbi:CENP-B N and HTH Tnp Tc5 domain containing protei n [Trichuris trichiura]|uniref:CENP-B N and HTH Tnp Tc5 domain containing protei n n=1 Tax=Trichuris trichiura TaxID=36087 RepID=A0A077ZJ00_TRITR|nr:CENP-B N and HTH Tnp Tc5 domain containing protei n [Trichuris trichiura]